MSFHKKPDHHVIVGSNLIIKRISTIFFINIFTHIKRRMGWHKSESQPERTKQRRRIIPHNLMRFIRMNKMHVAIYGFQRFISIECFNNFPYDIITRKIIIRI